MTEPVSHRPSDAGVAMGMLAGLVGAIAAVAYSPIGAIVGFTGLVLLVLGIALPRPGFFGFGATTLLAGVVVSGVYGAPAALLVVGSVGAVLAWDLLHNAASHGRQVGRQSASGTAEIAHAGGSLTAGGVVAVLLLAIDGMTGGGYSTTAVGLLAMAAVLLVLSLR